MFLLSREKQTNVSPWYMVDEKGKMRFSFKNKGFSRTKKHKEMTGTGAGAVAVAGELCTNSQAGPHCSMTV